VISGSGTVCIEDTKEACAVGDVIVLPVNQKHKIIGKHLHMIAITKPDWYEEQAEIIKGM
jgi:mannose-6-phosphate isomerase-like protein (cupin superfamily)